MRASMTNPLATKNPNKPSCIDFILTNSSLSFYKSNRLFTDWYKLLMSVLKQLFQNQNQRKLFIETLNKFNEEDLNQKLRGKLSTELFINYSSFVDNLNKRTPLKKKVITANHAPYVTKALMKAIMKRFQLAKIFFRKKKPRIL